MCGGGPDQVTSTTRNEPSPMLIPSIRRAAGDADQLGLYNQNYLADNLSNSFGYNQPTRDAVLGQAGGDVLGQIFGRGTQGSPLTDAAQGLTQQTIAGDFLNSNPYLDQTFNRAADLTRTRLSSEFAGAGRDLGAARPARSEELQTLASNIYGGNYQAERNRQMQAVNQSMPLANQDFANLQQAYGATQQPINDLINRIGALAPAAGGTAISSQPVVSTGLFGGLF